MGFWDALCPLCGVAPSGGPQYLAAEWTLDEDLKPVVAELRQRGVAGLGKELDDTEFLNVLKEGFLSGIVDELVLPRGYGKGDYCQNYVGIGYWSVGAFDGLYRRTLSNSRSVPDGKNVGVLRLRHADGYGGKFNAVLEKDKDGKTEEVSRRTYCDPYDSPCLFLCEHCYHYLAAWLDLNSFPDRSHAFPHDPEPLAFAGELYEIINSREAQRGYSGILPEIEYDGVEDSLDQCQDYVFPGCWKDVRHTASAIEAGLRGKKLLPAIMRDSRVWMFMRPNVWPLPPKIDNTPKFGMFPFGQRPAIAGLPLELLIPLLAQLPLVSILVLSATCRSLRNLITNPPLLDRVLKEAITSGSLRWIYPVGTIPKSENNLARKALLAWMSNNDENKIDMEGGNATGNEAPLAPVEENVDGEGVVDNELSSDSEPEGDEDEDDADEEDTGGEDPVALLASPGFPRLAFVRACWESDSMMNRRRLWGQVNRFEALWRDYRTNGWQVQVFYPSEELENENSKSQ